MSGASAGAATAPTASVGGFQALSSSAGSNEPKLMLLTKPLGTARAGSTPRLLPVTDAGGTDCEPAGAAGKPAAALWGRAGLASKLLLPLELLRGLLAAEAPPPLLLSGGTSALGGAGSGGGGGRRWARATAW